MLVEYGAWKRSKAEGTIDNELGRLEVEAHVRKPTEWQGWKVRGAANGDSAQEQHDAEESYRSRWAKEVFESSSRPSCLSYVRPRVSAVRSSSNVVAEDRVHVAV